MGLKDLKKYVKPVLIGIAAAAAAAVAGVVLYAKTYLTAEVIETTLSRTVLEQLHRRLACRNITFSVFDGIRLGGVTIEKSLPEEADDFFTCDEIAMDVSFWPLLFKKLVIRSLAVTNPRLSLQAASGAFGITGRERPGAPEGPSLELLFLPASLTIAGGTVSYFDHRENFGIQFGNVHLDADSISYILPFTFTASAGIDPSTTPDIQLSGRCFVPAREITAELSVPEVDLGRFRPFFALSGIPLKKATGRITVSVKTKGSGPVELEGAVSLKDAQLLLVPPRKTDDEISLEGATAELNFQAAYDPATGATDIGRLRGRLLGAPFEGSGSLPAGGAGPELHLRCDRLSLDELSTRLAYGAASPFLGLRLSGYLGLAIDLSPQPGSASFPIITLKLRNNHIIYPALGSLQPTLDGTLTFDSRAITLTDLRLGTKSAGVVLAGTLANYLAWPPQADIRIVSSDFNFYQFFYAPEKEQGEDIGPFDFGALKFDGPLDIGDVTFLNLDLAGVRGSYLFENSRFSIRNFTGGIKQGGSFALDIGVDLSQKGFAYSLNLALADVPARLLGELAGIDLTPFMEGLVTGSARLSARGTSSVTFTGSLAGDAALRVNGCRIRGLAMPQQLGRFVRGDALSRLEFTDADVLLTLRRDAVDVSGSFLSPQVELYPEGRIGFNAQIDGQAQLRLAADVFSAESRIAEYLPREGPWVVLPLAVKGTIDRPVMGLADDAITYIMQETLPRLFMDMLEKARSEAAPAESEPPPEAEPEPGFEEEFAE